MYMVNKFNNDEKKRIGAGLSYWTGFVIVHERLYDY